MKRPSGVPRSPPRPPAGTFDVRVRSSGVRAPLGAATVRAIAELVLTAERCRSALVEITFVSDRTIAGINRRHLGHRGATDIVTFEHARTTEALPVVGDLYIAPGIARANARAAGVSAREEAARLVIHGVLHALGRQHPDDETRLRSPMWRRQETLLRRAADAGLV